VSPTGLLYYDNLQVVPAVAKLGILMVSFFFLNLLYYGNLQPGQPFTSKHLPEGAHINTKEHPLPLIEKPIDYTLGVVTRTPRVDCRNNVLKGPHNVMSLVFDLVKEA
jgi:hypothetical protein